MKHPGDRLSGISTSSAGSGSMLGHVTTIAMDGGLKSGQSQVRGRPLGLAIKILEQVKDALL